MSDELWIAAISSIAANASSMADEVPLSFVHREGLALEHRNTVDESQTLRLLRLSVQGLDAWTLTLEGYEENVAEVMDVARAGWLAVHNLQGGDKALKESVAECFAKLFEACDQMLDHPHEGLEAAIAAYKDMERMSQRVQAYVEQETDKEEQQIAA